MTRPQVDTSEGACASAQLRRANLLHLVFITYALICGGAYGLEPIVSSAGPGLALLVLALFPFVYAAPIALTCSELASRYPVEGGYYRWTRMAFGDLAGFSLAWLMWLTLFATNASFVVLCGNYLRYFVPSLSPGAQFAVSAALIWTALFLNYRGIEIVGSISTVLMLLIFIPFIALTALGFLHWSHNPLAPFANPDQPFSTALCSALLIAIWLYGGFEKVTVTASEVENPARAFPIALGVGVVLCAASYILPTLAALAAKNDWRNWGESHFTTSALALGGPALAACMAAGGVISNAGIAIAAMLSQSRLPMVLAEDGFLPALFRRTHPRYRTPSASLLVTAVLLTAFCTLDFAQLVEIYAVVQSLAYLLIYAALFKLRAQPDASRRIAFRIPLGNVGLAAMFLPTLLIGLVVIQQHVFSRTSLKLRQTLLELLIFGSAPASYAIVRWRRMIVLKPELH
jgi:amino acid transporter